jgi:hypothetical protein
MRHHRIALEPNRLEQCLKAGHVWPVIKDLRCINVILVQYDVQFEALIVSGSFVGSLFIDATLTLALGLAPTVSACQGIMQNPGRLPYLEVRRLHRHLLSRKLSKAEMYAPKFLF